MGYAEHLKELLRPLRLYELDSGPGGAELSALGAEMDALESALDSALAEALPPTAAGEGLSAYESILPYKPRWLTPADRRRAVTALLRIDGSSFTPSALNATLAGCGLRAVAEETVERNTLRVSFPYNRGTPEGLGGLKERIEAILPCHLNVEYLILYVSWQELQSLYPTWAQLDAAALSWNELERSGAEG